MSFTPLLQDLLAALRCLPGVGPKSSQRMAFHLLERDRDGAQRLIRALQAALDRIGLCVRCRMFAETELCTICSDPRRDAGLVCVVETPADVIAIEESGVYRGRYFVLMGRLSPLDGIGPDQLGVPVLEAQLRDDAMREMILATSATVEGEATSGYLASIAREHRLCATRIAHGVPMGGELEYVDAGTLSHAITARTPVLAE
ncbi:MAG: recombination protein RecR [Chromatiales bacterium]|jgi:recombination protein RecR|nr:MAG: recombination protein RecR [Chromatiales bacterium]